MEIIRKTAARQQDSLTLHQTDGLFYFTAPLMDQQTLLKEAREVFSSAALSHIGDTLEI